jgi:hypothetical protein
MAGGIDISQTAGAALGAASTLGSIIITQANNATLTAAPIWRPPQWNKAATFVLTVPSSVAGRTNSLGALNQTAPNGQYTVQAGVQNSVDQIFVFDAVLSANHNQTLAITEHPVQTGSNISDNAVLRPTLIELEIGMSDAMDSFTPGMWSGNSSKSVAAYQQLLTIQKQRTFVNLATRLNSYTNLLIENISANETSKSFAGLRCRITFRQIFLAQVVVGNTGNGARPNATDTTKLATVQVNPVTTADINNNKVLASPTDETQQGNITQFDGFQVPSSISQALLQNGIAVPGAGTYSSSNIDAINTALSNTF